MGTQACVFYGAAEFSRILDLLILEDATNLATALLALNAEVIAVPLWNSGICCAGTRSIFAAAGKMLRDCESI